MKYRRFARGLSLVEVLITLAICSALMTAVATAFSATAQAMSESETFFRASQTARVSLTQLTAELRRCRSCDVGTTEMELVTSLGETREYFYHAASKQLRMKPHIGPAPWKEYVLARDVESARFTASGESVSVTLTIATGHNRVTLSGAAVPRKTVKYE